MNDLAYQVVDPHQIRIHPGRRTAGPTYQYEPYPESFERRGLVLVEGVPGEIRRIYRELVARWDAGDDDGPVPVPSPEDQETLTEFFGHPVPLPRSFFHHQFGGKPAVDYWAGEVFECPNPACEGGVIDRVRRRRRGMKFLAGVLNDPWAGLPMVEPATDETRRHWNYGVSVQYHICDCCWTVLGCNRCD